MLTVAYCRVSTEEQAAEGFSIAGQADKLPRLRRTARPRRRDGHRRPGTLRQEPRAARAAATAAHGRRGSRRQRDHLEARPAVEELGRPHHAGRPFRAGQRRPALVHREDRPVVGDGPDVLQHPRFLRAVLPGATGRERAHGHAAGRAPGQVGQSSEDRLRPHRRRARPQRDGASRPAHLHNARRGG